MCMRPSRRSRVPMCLWGSRMNSWPLIGASGLHYKALYVRRCRLGGSRLRCSAAGGPFGSARGCSARSSCHSGGASGFSLIAPLLVYPGAPWGVGFVFGLRRAPSGLLLCGGFRRRRSWLTGAGMNIEAYLCGANRACGAKRAVRMSSNTGVGPWALGLHHQPGHS